VVQYYVLAVYLINRIKGQRPFVHRSVVSMLVDW